MAITTALLAASPSANTIYSSTGNTAITTLIFCNTNQFNAGAPTANTVTLTLHIVPNATSAGPGNMIVNQLPIPAGETFTFDTEKVILTQGDSVVAFASAANLSAVISYMSV